MPYPSVNVLLVEDNPGDARLIQDAMNENRLDQFSFKHASRMSEALDRLDSVGIDVILLDLGLPDCQGLETLAKACKAGHGIPVIVLTGRDDESLAMDAVRNGAEDYLVKGQAQGSAIVRSIRYSMERRLFREALKESEDRYQLMIETSEEGVWLVDADYRTVFVNRKMASMLGHTPGAMLEQPVLSFVDPADHATMRAKIARRQNGVREQYDLRLRRKDGSLLWALCSAAPVLDEFGRHQGTLGMVTDITQRKRTEETLRKSESRLARAHQIARLGHWEWDFVTRDLYWSNELYEIFGCSRGTRPTHERFLKSVHPDDLAGVTSAIEASVVRSAPYEIEHRIVLSDKSIRTLSSRGEVEIDEGGKPARLVGTTKDITERVQLALQLRQSQKMDVVGRLAGGIAHDFNNLLTVISGYSELTLARMNPKDPNRAEIEEVLKASQKAASLTRQLLAFSRKQMLAPKVISLNSVVKDMDKLLRRLIEEQITLSARLDPGLGLTRMDPGQMEQVIMNLAVNARDAMPQGGKLILETTNVMLDEDYARSHSEVKAGPHVMLAVTDTGIGMNKEVLSHLFEPFYTTKEPGKGTGLGLSTVYGILKQSGGNVTVYSEPSHGTTFKVYLPRVDDPESAPAVPRSIGSLRGTESILLVEDDEAVRTLTRNILTSQGYQVMSARDSEEAQALAGKPQGNFQLLLTDVVMPGMSGPELARLLLGRKPGLKTLFISGYTDVAAVSKGLVPPGSDFLQKPFTADELLVKVRKVLEG
jgi:PAS domain S-box-containing protein